MAFVVFSWAGRVLAWRASSLIHRWSRCLLGTWQATFFYVTAGVSQTVALTRHRQPWVLLNTKDGEEEIAFRRKRSRNADMPMQ
jgi:hypothetical protein